MERALACFVRDLGEGIFCEQGEGNRGEQPAAPGIGNSMRKWTGKEWTGPLSLVWKGVANGKKEVADSVRVQKKREMRTLTRKLTARADPPVPSTQRRHERPLSVACAGCAKNIYLWEAQWDKRVRMSVCMAMGMEATTTADETDERGAVRSASRRD